ncbi:MAG: serine/threonine protein kinase [Acidobacteriota bacterium]|nr:serine/threonine protein kinase [Acidobacteriota bacterium]
MVYADGVEFWLDQDCSTLWANWPASNSIEDTISYLVGPVLGLVLRLRGLVCLHASAVNIEDRAVVFVGPEGAGKSTTAAAFARQGFPLVSDDIVALVERDHEFQVLPAYPRINLWPDSVLMLFGAPDALPLITPAWDKRCLKVGETAGTRFQEGSLPLGAIYIFGDVMANSKQYVETIRQKTALMMLIGNTYATNFLDANQRADEFAILSRVVGATQVRIVNPRREGMGLESLCRAIRDDLARMGSGTIGQ